MKFKNYLQNYKHVWCLALILLMGIFCFAWVGYDTVGNALGVGHREIIHDDYTQLTQPIIGQEGIVQKIEVAKDTSFYGVNLNFHTFNRVCYGTVYAVLMDENRQVLAQDSCDLTQLKDNTFHRFIFGENFKSKQDETYYLSIYTEPQSPQDKVALWKSEKTKSGFSLEENGAPVQGTVALQYITKYIDSGLKVYYGAIAVFLLIFLAVLYVLLFVKKVKIETVFIVFALFLGVVFCIYTPQRGGPDEYVHIASSYYNVNNILGIKNSYQDGKLLMRAEDSVPLLKPANYNVFEIQETYQGLAQGKAQDTEMVWVPARKAEVFPFLYYPQTLGVLLGRLLGLSYVWVLVLGRLCNLLVYTGLVYLALRYIPFYKTSLAVLALTPIPLQLAGSFSYDTLLIGTSFLFIALCLNFAYTQKEMTLKKVLILALLGGFIAPSKTVYILLVGLCLIIPRDRFKSPKLAILSFAFVFAVSVSTWLVYNGAFLKTLAPAPTSFSEITIDKAQETASLQLDYSQNPMITEELVPEANADSSEQELPIISEDTPVVEKDWQAEMYIDISENGDNRNYFTFGYIIKHIPQTLKLVINTLQENTQLYIKQLFGGVLGEVIVSPLHINWLYVIGVMVIVYLSAVSSINQPIPPYQGARKLWGLLIALGCCGLFVLACITWTPINYTTIFGIQGRYFYPVLPLIVWAICGNTLTLKKEIKPQLIFSLAVINVLILLNGFTIMMANTKI